MDIKASIIPRKDESNDINAQIKVKDEIKNLNNQISHLQFIIGM